MKPIAEWERDLGLVINGKVDGEQKVTAEDMDAMIYERGSTGVDYDARVQFLTDNGYEATRENLVDWQLPAREVPTRPNEQSKSTK